MTADESTRLRNDPSGGPVRRTLLIIIDDAIVAHPLPETGELSLGRGQGATIRVDHPSVSRMHAALELGPVLRIRDLGSGNGTSLRGARIPAARSIEIGANETVLLGDVAVVVQERRAPLRSGPAQARSSVSRGESRGRSSPIVQDPAMRNVFDLARRIAIGSISVLVVGESGSGKEVLADAIHAASQRARGPLVKVNCAAIASALFESELFGHERGAFTGATAAKPGLIETADKGTLFLDEIGELSVGVQAKLLRVIEDRRVQRVGAVEAKPVDVRFVAATHRDLEAEVAAGRFREDLYYRIAAIVLEVPPLRDRPSEIEALARGFADAAAAALGRTVPIISDDALASLLAHDWPGNVREMRNAVERAVLLADDTIRPEHLFGPRGRRGDTSTQTIHAATPDGGGDERGRIMAALEQCAGNQTRAAELLGMSRRTLVKRLVDYDIRRPKRR